MFRCATIIFQIQNYLGIRKPSIRRSNISDHGGSNYRNFNSERCTIHIWKWIFFSSLPLAPFGTAECLFLLFIQPYAMSPINEYVMKQYIKYENHQDTAREKKKIKTKKKKNNNDNVKCYWFIMQKRCHSTYKMRERKIPTHMLYRADIFFSSRLMSPLSLTSNLPKAKTTKKEFKIIKRH